MNYVIKYEKKNEKKNERKNVDYTTAKNLQLVHRIAWHSRDQTSTLSNNNIITFKSDYNKSYLHSFIASRAGSDLNRFPVAICLSH